MAKLARASAAGALQRPLAGRLAWVITDGKAGMEVQVAGVAAALEAKTEIKRVNPRGLWRRLAPWAPPDPRERPGKPESQFAPPWPDIALATGRLSIPVLRTIRRRSPDTFTVIVQDPRTGVRSADLIAVPSHDALEGENVIQTLTAPHGFAPERLEALRKRPRGALAKLPSPRVAVLLGGPNAVYSFPGEHVARLAGSVASLGRLGAGFLITVSRRTPVELMEAVRTATRHWPRVIWTGTGDNPYEQFLAHADMFIVTADSVNMTGEACATGRPVYVFEPQGGSPKFETFHEALRRYGATKPLPGTFERIESWRYAPLDSAAQIAREIERRWSARQGSAS